MARPDQRDTDDARSVLVREVRCEQRAPLIEGAGGCVVRLPLAGRDGTALGRAMRASDGYRRATMRATYAEMVDYARPYLDRARKLEAAGDSERARAFDALGRAYQLMANWRSPALKRGEFFDPTSVPDVAALRNPTVLAIVKAKLGGVKHLVRRTRLADVLWEYGDRQIEAACIACDGYLEQGRAGLASGEDHAAMYAAGALSRALDLARSIHDAEREREVLAMMAEALARFVGAGKTVALFMVAEALLAWKIAQHRDAVQQALTTHLTALRASEMATFHHQRTALELLCRIMAARGDQGGARALQVEIGETMAREAQARPEGSGADLVLSERAAQYFDQLGDHRRAQELRRGQREAIRGMHFGVVQGEFEIELAPIREWIARMLKLIPRPLFWGGVLFHVPTPTPEEPAELANVGASETPLVNIATHVLIEAEGAKEILEGGEAMRRMVRENVYGRYGVYMHELVDLAKREYGITAREALPVLESTGRFDATGLALARRILDAIDGGDWLTAAHLAPPLFERLLRRLADEVGIWTRRTDTQAGGSRQEYKSIETLLRELPLAEPVREFAKHVLTYPGRNLRNEVGHGYLDEDRCTRDLGAQIFHLLLALALADLASTGTPGGA